MESGAGDTDLGRRQPGDAWAGIWGYILFGIGAVVAIANGHRLQIIAGAAVAAALAISIWLIWQFLSGRRKLSWAWQLQGALGVGDLDGAQELLKKAESSAPSDDPYYREVHQWMTQLCEAMLQFGRGEYALAGPTLENVANCSSWFMSRKARQLGLRCAVECYVCDKNYRKATELWQLLPKKMRGSPAKHKFMALAYHELGEFAAAADALAGATDMPEIERLKTQLGWYFAGGKYEAVKAVAAKLAAVLPTIPEAAPYAKLSKLSPRKLQHLWLTQRNETLPTERGLPL